MGWSHRFVHLLGDKNHFLWGKFVCLWKFYIWCIHCSEALQILLWKLTYKNSVLRETKINLCFSCTSQILPKMNEGIRTIRRRKELQLAYKYLGNQAIIAKEMQKKNTWQFNGEFLKYYILQGLLKCICDILTRLSQHAVFLKFAWV